jgi:hypothetical protein
MDKESLVQLARTMPKDRFVASFQNRFLVLDARPRTDDFDFDTAISEVAPDPTGRAREVEILEIVKARNNPYADRISIGRARNCDLVLRDPSVSKLHAHLREGGGLLQVVDLGSQNGTKVNGADLSAHTPQPVKIGDQLIFGRVSGKLHDAASLYALLRGT